MTSYWTLFQWTEDGMETVCKPFDNNYATIDALRAALVQSCKKNLGPDQFCITGGIRRRVEIVLARYQEGSQVISLEPYLLRSRADLASSPIFDFTLQRNTVEPNGRSN